MTAAATALQAGIPLGSIRDMRDAAAGSREPASDLAGALVAFIPRRAIAPVAGLTPEPEPAS